MGFFLRAPLVLLAVLSKLLDTLISRALGFVAPDPSPSASASTNPISDTSSSAGFLN